MPDYALSGDTVGGPGVMPFSGVSVYKPGIPVRQNTDLIMRDKIRNIRYDADAVLM